jgi:hypothetical protein
MLLILRDKPWLWNFARSGVGVDLGSGIESVERAGGIDDGSAGIDGTATVCTAMQQSQRRVTATASICLLSTHYLTTFYLRRAISWWIRRPSSQNLARQA